MTLALARLAFAGIGRSRLETALTVLVALVATATITVALTVRGVAEAPWERTFEATRGPHVVAFSFSEDLRPLATEPGVAATAGPFPGTLTSLRHQGRRFGVQLQARPQAPAAVDRPAVTQGSWLRPGSLVLERSYARGLGIRAGDQVVLAGAAGPVSLTVAGLAVTTTQSRYPESQPGLAWVLPATFEAVQPDRERWTSVLFLRLERPDAAALFGQRRRPPPGQVTVQHWRELRAGALEDTRVNQVILATFSLLLVLATGFALATIVGGRALVQSRQLAVLKAAGLTPAQVATVFLLENLLLCGAGAILGALLGAALAPVFAATSAEVLGRGAEASFAVLPLAAATVIVLAVAAVGSWVPCWRRARNPTTAMLAPPLSARRSRLHRAAWRLGLPPAALVGVKEAFIRPGRASLVTLSLALAVAAVVSALAMESTLALESSRSVAPDAGLTITDAAGQRLTPEAAPADDGARLRPLVYGLDAVTLAVALVTLLTTTLLSVRERGRELGILKALGFTPRQLVQAVMANHVVLAATALVVGIPLGLALFRGAYAAAGGGPEELAWPPAWQLAVLCVLAAATFASLAGAAARRTAFQPVVEALRQG